jgi:hypothetical protein
MGQSTYIRDGFVSAGNAQVSGSLGVTGGITGSLLGTATTASYVLLAVSASYAPGGESGTVNTGAANKLAYYPSAGTTVDDTTNLEYDGSGNLIVSNTGQIGFSTTPGLIYFGTFGSPSYGRAGFSVPGQSVMVIDYSTARAGFGGGTGLITGAPSGLVEIQGKADEIQLLVKGHSTQTNNIFQAQTSGGSQILTLTNSSTVNINGSLLMSGSSLVAGFNPIPLEGTIQDGVTSVLGDLANWNSNYYQGDVLYSETAGGTITFGQLCYRTQNNVWILADATSISAAAINMLGICIKSSTSTNPTSILINGFVEIASYASVSKSGEPQYMATTAGSMTRTAPATAGNIVRLIGHTFWASNTNTKIIIRFNPENSWIEL